MTVSFGIVGYGVSGQAAAAWCEKNGHSYFLVDDTREGLPNQRSIDHLTASDAARWIISPGVPPTHTLVALLEQNTANISTDVGIYAESFVGKLVGVTGTNGKTTVTEMITQLLADSGLKVAALGNVGFSPLAMDDENLEAAVLELSSFQLYYSSVMRLDVACITNISADHLDWHRDYEEYVQSKNRILAGAVVAILDADDKGLNQAAGALDLPERVYYVSTNYIPEQGILVEQGKVVVRIAGIETEYDASGLSLRGAHNRRNLGMALLAGVALGVPVESGLKALAHYRSGAHRMERVKTVGNITCIDDSKATNPHAVEAALSAFVQPVVLLLGGVDKGGEFKSIGTNWPNLKALVLFGRDRDQIAESLSSALPIHLATGLENAVQKGLSLCADGDVLLLSPGCASFDEFSGYAERGDRFQALVRSLT